MVRAIGLLVAAVALELMFGDLHPWEFLAKRLAPPVRLVPPAPPVPRPFDGYGVNPLLKREANPFLPDIDPPPAPLPEKN